MLLVQLVWMMLLLLLLLLLPQLLQFFAFMDQVLGVLPLVGG